jgi:glycerate 2-kinase
MNVMKILVAPDSFKHSLTAAKVAEAVIFGAGKVRDDLQFEIVPLSDGGEGFTESLVEGSDGTYSFVEVHDALMRKIPSRIGILEGGKKAVIELAAAAGIEKLTENERNPWITTTYGVGELIYHALEHNVETLIIGVGGSATNDAGAGMAQALGVRFLDKDGNEIEKGGGALSKLHSIDLSHVDQRMFTKKIIVACDVSNPLTGNEGASYVYGPQKGADPEMVKMLDINLHHFADKLKEATGNDVDKVPGAGAAGGISATLLAIFGASLVPGFEIVKNATQLDEKLKGCTMVITGEGKIDEQTRFGKVPYALAQLARKQNLPVIAFAGTLGEGYEILYQHGFHAIIPICEQPVKLDIALQKASTWLENASERFFRIMKLNSDLKT